MRKHNEGYVLPLVMVVLIVLCAVSLSVLAPATNNLKAQDTSIDRMQERYELIGIAGQVTDDFTSNFPHTGSVSKTYESMGEEGILTSLKNLAQAQIIEELNALGACPGVDAAGNLTYNARFDKIISSNFTADVYFSITYSIVYPDSFTTEEIKEGDKTLTKYTLSYSVILEEFEPSTIITSKGGNG